MIFIFKAFQKIKEQIHYLHNIFTIDNKGAII